MLAPMRVSCSPDKSLFQQVVTSLLRHLCGTTCYTLLVACIGEPEGYEAAPRARQKAPKNETVEQVRAK